MQDMMEHPTRKSYSQLNQDILALEYFKNKEGGYFVDIGANDGKSLSNTYLLEKEYHWKGICVEPLQKEFKMCQECRPNSICVNKCIYNVEKEIEFSEIDGTNNMYSGIKKDINHHKHIVDHDAITTKKESITFQTLLDNCNCPRIIDFLSLDTEGSELKILHSLDHDKYKFRYITLEHNYKEPIRSFIRDFLIGKGYQYVGQNQWDDIYSGSWSSS